MLPRESESHETRDTDETICKRGWHSSDVAAGWTYAAEGIRIARDTRYR